MYHRRRTRARTDEGATAVEFALISIPLLTLLIGIIQFSIWLWAFQAGSHAAREGARLAAVDPCSESAIDARVIDRVGAAATASFDPVVTEPSPVEVGSQITVSLEFDAFVIGPFEGILPSIQKSATTRIEYIPEDSCD